MKTIFTLLVSISMISANAQNTGKEEYLTARIVSKDYANAYVLYLDYSELKGKNYIDPNYPVWDSSRFTFKFKSESAALNYLAKQSWIIVAVIPILYQGSSSETKYIFRRKITGEPLPIARPTAE
jgi:hypothetical protein